MAVENLKDFAIQWTLFGLLFFSLLAFATTFIYNNNPGALGDEGDKLGIYQTDMEGKLLIIEDSSNNLLNISAQNDPEVSDQGSKDSVATSYGIMGTSKTFLDSTKLFMGWIFTGTAGKMLVSIFVGMFGLLSVYFITKWIRNGI